MKKLLFALVIALALFSGLVSALESTKETDGKALLVEKAVKKIKRVFTYKNLDVAKISIYKQKLEQNNSIVIG